MPQNWWNWASLNNSHQLCIFKLEIREFIYLLQDDLISNPCVYTRQMEILRLSEVHYLPYKLDLANLVNCKLTFIKSLTRDTVAHINSWIKPIPEAAITWMKWIVAEAYLDELESEVGGGKTAKGQKNPLWATTWASELCFSDGIRDRVVTCLRNLSSSKLPRSFFLLTWDSNFERR